MARFFLGWLVLLTTATAQSVRLVVTLSERTGTLRCKIVSNGVVEKDRSRSRGGGWTNSFWRFISGKESQLGIVQKVDLTISFVEEGFHIPLLVNTGGNSDGILSLVVDGVAGAARMETFC
jgi:hypothetical protein